MDRRFRPGRRNGGHRRPTGFRHVPVRARRPSRRHIERDHQESGRGGQARDGRARVSAALEGPTIHRRLTTIHQRFGMLPERITQHGDPGADHPVVAAAWRAFRHVGDHRGPRIVVQPVVTVIRVELQEPAAARMSGTGPAPIWICRMFGIPEQYSRLRSGDSNPSQGKSAQGARAMRMATAPSLTIPPRAGGCTLLYSPRTCRVPRFRAHRRVRTRKPVDQPRRSRRSRGLIHGCYSIIGAISRAKLFRARFKRLLTVPREHPVMSAISS